MNYSDIVSYGCSYTAGEELMDPTIHADCEKIKQEKGLEHWWNHYRLNWHMDENSIIERELATSWPNTVAQMMGLPLHNRARSGSSLPWSLFSLEQDLNHGSISEHCLILVGVTGMHRSLHWNRSALAESWLHHHQPYPQPEWHRDTVLGIYNDAQCLWLHLTYLLRFCEISSKIDHRVKLFEMNANRFQVKSMVEKVREQGIDFTARYQQLCQSGVFFDRETLMGMVRGSREQHVGHHPIRAVHERYGQWVHATLIDGNL